MSTYRIRSGDTLWALSKRFGTTVNALVKANGIANPNLIITGHTLRIPDGLDAPKPAKTPVKTPVKKPARTGTPETPTPSRPPAGTKPGKVALHDVPRGQAAQYAYFQNLVKQAGGRFKTGANQFNLVGMRTTTNTNTNGGQGSYDDKLAMVWKDSAGKPHVKLLRYNTEPAKAMSAYSNDVNGDGRADQGRIPEGHYEFQKSSWKHGFCLRATRDFQVERDMNHDGRFNDNKKTGGGASMLFHQGGTYGTGSAGCQTFPPSEWARFVSTLNAARGPLGYTLITRNSSSGS